MIQDETTLCEGSSSIDTAAAGIKQGHSTFPVHVLRTGNVLLTQQHDFKKPIKNERSTNNKIAKQ